MAAEPLILAGAIHHALGDWPIIIDANGDAYDVTRDACDVTRDADHECRPCGCGSSLLPHADRQIPLSVKYDTKPLWADLKALIGVNATGAAIAIALYEAHKLDAAVSYSRSKPYYVSKHRHQLLSYRKVINAAAHLEASKLIHHFKQTPGGRGWQSAMRATDELAELVDRLLEGQPRLSLLMPQRGIILRDAEGLPVDLKPTRQLGRLNRGVAAINEAVTSVEVLAGDGTRLTAPMIRIFNSAHDLSRGGRWYAVGASWQNAPKLDRHHITLDGEQVVELDYATLHPAMLYAEVGAPLPADCYSIEGWPRALVKRALLTLVNARTIHSARLSIAHCDAMPFQAGSQDAIAAASRLIKDIKRTHKPIEQAFHSDAGARLMRRDSDLAHAVMKHLLGQGIVALPIHDSFLVPASKRAELEAAMLRAAHEIGLRHIQVTETRSIGAAA